MANEKPPLGRRSYLINPEFQLKVIGYALFFALLIIGVFYCSQLYFFWKLIEVGRTLNFPADHPFFEFLGEQKRLMYSVFGVTALVSLSALVIAGLFLSHKVAGPVHRLKLYLNSIIEDEHFHELSFRKGDYFSDLAETLNRTLALYQRKGALPPADEDKKS